VHQNTSTSQLGKDPITPAVELVSVLLILSGAAAAAARFLSGRIASVDAHGAHRQHLGRAILLGLQVAETSSISVDPKSVVSGS
jgi:uncharacterized membrane protein